MIKSIDELVMEQEALLDALNECDPEDEARIQELQDRLDVIEEELDLNPDNF